MNDRENKAIWTSNSIHRCVRIAPLAASHVSQFSCWKIRSEVRSEGRGDRAPRTSSAWRVNALPSIYKQVRLVTMHVNGGRRSTHQHCRSSRREFCITVLHARASLAGALSFRRPACYKPQRLEPSLHFSGWALSSPSDPSSFAGATLLAAAARRGVSVSWFVSRPAANSRACATQLSRWMRPDDAR
jgi:hypothetical protein